MDRYPIYPPGFMRPSVEAGNMHTNGQAPMPESCEPALAQATIGVQKWREIYECDKALMRGTLFCELDKPFRGSDR